LKIALIGVDGAGKTTIIKELSKEKNVKVIYMGFKEFKFENLIKFLSKFGKFGLILQHFLVYIENWMRYLKAKKYEKEGFIVFFDRYPKVDYQVASKGTFFFYNIFYEYFFPMPDKIILIKGDTNEIYKRKPELSKDEIKELQKKLEKLDIYNAIITNKTGYLEDTLDSIKELIL